MINYLQQDSEGTKASRISNNPGTVTHIQQNARSSGDESDRADPHEREEHEQRPTPVLLQQTHT